MKRFIVAAAVAMMGTTAYADDMFVGVSPRVDAAQGPDGGSLNAPFEFTRLNNDIMLMSPGETVDLPALNGEPLVAELDRITTYESGMRAWVGRIEGAGIDQRVLVTELNGLSFGRIQTEDGVWNIIPSFSGGGHEIFQHPENAIREGWGQDGISLPDADTLIEMAAQGAPQDGDVDSPDIAVGSLGTVDLVIFYSESFSDLWGIASGGRMQYLVALLDQAMVDSDTGVRARIAGTFPVTVDETASNSDSLSDLQDGAGDGVAGADQDFSSYLAMRNAVGADIAILLRRHFSSSRSGSSCGVGYVLTDGSGNLFPGFENFGLNVTSDWINGDDTDLGDGYSFCSDFTLAHETGHNMGNAHNTEDAGTGGLFDYSNGHREDCYITTIMAYDSSGDVSCGGINDAPGPGNEEEVPYFSNPDLSVCAGRSCGIPEAEAQSVVGGPADTTTPTDVARSIRVEGANVVDFRSEVRALRSALLPVSRSVETGTPATAFVSVINPASSGVTATGCGLRLPGATTDQFTFRPWDGSSFTAAAGTEVSIPAGDTQDFVIAVTSDDAFADDVTSVVPSDNDETELFIEAYCDNLRSAEYTNGLNSLLFTASVSPVPDIIALAGTLPAAPGYVEVPTTGNMVGVFSVAISNVGAGGFVTATTDTGSNSDMAIDEIEICETDPGTGACTSPRAATASVTVLEDGTASFGVFVRGDGDVIENTPAENRVFVRFSVGGIVRGATSVAVCTDGAGGAC